MGRGNRVLQGLGLAALVGGCHHLNPDYDASESKGGGTRGSSGSAEGPSTGPMTSPVDTSAGPTTNPEMTTISTSVGSTSPPTSDSTDSVGETNDPPQCAPPPDPVEITVVTEGKDPVLCTDIRGPVMGMYSVQAGVLALELCLDCENCMPKELWYVELGGMSFPDMTGCGEIVLFHEGGPACPGFEGLLIHPSGSPGPSFFLTNSRDLPPPAVGVVPIAPLETCPVPPNECPPEGSGEYALNFPGVRTIPPTMTRTVTLDVPEPTSFSVTNVRSVIDDECDEHFTWFAIVQ